MLRMAEALKNPDLTDVVNDDRVMLHTQYSTQWDALRACRLVVRRRRRW